MTAPATSTITRALLDTAIVLDWRKMQARREEIDRLLKGYNWRCATSITFLEFKATIIQECIFLYNLFRERKHFSRVVDEVTESQHRQTPLRLHVVHNLLQVCETVPASEPHREVVKAELAAESLETTIPELHDWFRSTELVDQILWDRVNCTRAAERPVKKLVRFETNLPTCKRHKNKRCHVEEVLRQNAELIRQTLTPHANPNDEQPNQFRRTLTVVERVVAEPRADLSHDDCRKAGDCLIAIEGRGQATHALSTNRTEWEVVAPMAGMEFVHVTYPKG